MAKQQLNTAHEIKRRVFADPTRLPKDIFEELTKLGVKTSLSTVSTYRTDFLNSVALLREIGALPPAPPAPAQPKATKPAKATKTREAKGDAKVTPEADAEAGAAPPVADELQPA